MQGEKVHSLTTSGHIKGEITWKSMEIRASLENSIDNFFKLEIEFLCDPAIQLLRIYFRGPKT